MAKSAEEERLERWRLVLGEPAQGTLGAALGETELRMDRALAALYDSERKAGLGGSSPHVARWLGDIREYFPSSVVRVMQEDAMTRLGLTEMLLQPEMLEAVEPDVQLVATLLSLRKVIPQKTKETARKVVRKVVEDLERRLRAPTEQAVRGALSRSSRTRRPRAAEIDWDRTMRANLRNYQPERKSVVVEKLVGHGRRRSSLRDIVLCIDQSGSMAASVVYSSIFGAVLASLRAVTTRMVVFDTAVVDLTEELLGSGGPAVRHPARRRHGHQPGARVLPADRHPAGADDPRAHHGPVRGRQRAADAPAGARSWCAVAWWSSACCR